MQIARRREPQKKKGVQIPCSRIPPGGTKEVQEGLCKVGRVTD